jgi:hypothetical protein
MQVERHGKRMANSRGGWLPTKPEDRLGKLLILQLLQPLSKYSSYAIE